MSNPAKHIGLLGIATVKKEEKRRMKSSKRATMMAWWQWQVAREAAGEKKTTNVYFWKQTISKFYCSADHQFRQQEAASEKWMTN